MRLKRLDLYVLRELWAPLLVGTFTVLLMFIANLLIVDYPNFQKQKASVWVVLQYAAYKMPSFLELTFPIGIALGSSLATSRLARESELTAIRAAGISLIRYVRPIVLVGVLIAFISFYTMENFVPFTEKKARSLRQQYSSELGGEDSRTENVMKLGRYMAFINYIEKKEEKRLNLYNVFLNENLPNKTVRLIDAEKGYYEEGKWNLENATVRILQNNILLECHTNQTFNFYEKINVASLFDHEMYGPKSAQDLTAKKLRKAIEDGRKRKRNTLDLEVAYYNKYSVPAACVVFALTGPVFASRLIRSGPFVGMLMSILLVMAYYNIFVIFTEIIGHNGWLPTVFCSWFPNLLFLITGLFMLRKNG